MKTQDVVPPRTEDQPGPPPGVDRHRPVVVAISGGSGTGKSTLAAKLQQELASMAPVILAQDVYFRDFAEFEPSERERVRTANHPDAMNWPAFHSALESLMRGRSVEIPAEGTRRAMVGMPRATLGPTGLIIIDGLFALWDERCRTCADLRLYTSVPDDERVLRRISRDVHDRGADLDHVVSWYRRDVQPNFERYTGASRAYADLVIPTDRPNQAAIDALCAAIRAIGHRRTIPPAEPLP